MLDKKDWLKTELQIKHLSVFGSFAKGMNRLDSDIDLLVCFSGDLTSEEKNKKVGELKQLCTMAFNRFTDLSEVSDYLNDDFIKNLPYVKKYFNQEEKNEQRFKTLYKTNLTNNWQRC